MLISTAKLGADRAANRGAETRIALGYTLWELEKGTPQEYNALSQAERKEAMSELLKRFRENPRVDARFDNILKENTLPEFGEALALPTEIPTGMWVSNNQRAAASPNIMLLLCAVVILALKSGPTQTKTEDQPTH
jgi:hypothetical protein